MTRNQAKLTARVVVLLAALLFAVLVGSVVFAGQFGTGIFERGIPMEDLPTPAEVYGEDWPPENALDHFEQYGQITSRTATTVGGLFVVQIRVNGGPVLWCIGDVSGICDRAPMGSTVVVGGTAWSRSSDPEDWGRTVTHFAVLSLPEYVNNV